MKLTIEQAREITDARNRAVVECDIGAFLGLWSDDCVVEGPEHLLEGKAALRTAMEGSWSGMRPIEMVTRSLAVRENAMFYEFALVSEVRATGNHLLLTGMTYHQVDDFGQLAVCREYFDPPGKPRRSAAEGATLAGLF